MLIAPFRARQPAGARHAGDQRADPLFGASWACRSLWNGGGWTWAGAAWDTYLARVGLAAVCGTEAVGHGQVRLGTPIWRELGLVPMGDRRGESAASPAMGLQQVTAEAVFPWAIVGGSLQPARRWGSSRSRPRLCSHGRSSGDQPPPQPNWTAIPAARRAGRGCPASVISLRPSRTGPRYRRLDALAGGVQLR